MGCGGDFLLHHVIEKKEAVLEIHVLIARGKQTRKSVAFMGEVSPGCWKGWAAV